MKVKRHNIRIWLIGHNLEAVMIFSELPSYKHLLGVFLHNHRTLNMSICESSKKVIEQFV